ncbi:hypothetical protein DIPPA_34743 [Diplonema papillatum]|nr:hypothetical protein DIPPA_34743 [Diplonema papillatum]
MYVGGVKPAPPATMRGAPLCRCGLPPAAELQPNVSPIPGLTSPSLARLVGTLDSIEFSIEPAREAELSPASEALQ